MNDHPAQNEKNAEIAARRREYFDALRHTFGAVAGKLVLRQLHAAAATHAPAYTPGGNIHDALYRDGRKSIVLEIEANLRAAEAEFGKAEPADKPKATGRRTTRRKGG